MRNIILVLSIFGLMGCSLFETRDENAGEQTSVVKKEVTNKSKLSKRSEDQGPRSRLMILPFLDASEKRPQSLRDSARDEFIDELNKTEEVIVVDSKDLKIDFSKSISNGDYNLSEIAKKAGELGVAAVLEGKIVDLRVKHKADEVGVFRQMKTTFECRARVRIVSTHSGKELFNTVKTVTIEEANVRVAETVDSDRFFQNNPEILENLVKETFLDFTEQILATVNKMSWEGRIAMINGDRIFLNVGRISGLNVGDVLKVTEEGEEVYDPQTGNYIGRVPGRLKGTLEVISYFGQDGAIAVIHSGAGFKENDKVEMY